MPPVIRPVPVDALQMIPSVSNPQPLDLSARPRESDLERPHFYCPPPFIPFGAPHSFLPLPLATHPLTLYVTEYGPKMPSPNQATYPGHSPNQGHSPAGPAMVEGGRLLAPLHIPVPSYSELSRNLSCQRQFSPHQRPLLLLQHCPSVSSPRSDELSRVVPQSSLQPSADLSGQYHNDNSSSSEDYSTSENSPSSAASNSSGRPNESSSSDDTSPPSSGRTDYYNEQYENVNAREIDESFDRRMRDHYNELNLNNQPLEGVKNVLSDLLSLAEKRVKEAKAVRPFKAYQNSRSEYLRVQAALDALLNINSAERFQDFQSKVEATQCASPVSNPNMRRTIKRKGDDSCKGQDDTYAEKRMRNNVAAKKSRDNRKKKEDMMALRIEFLENENLNLKTHLLRELSAKSPSTE